ncbi:hypothetical protein BH09SUM1_BH09SUM1_14170 [soil metagenome]
MPQRPTILTITATIAIIYAVLGVVCCSPGNIGNIISAGGDKLAVPFFGVSMDLPAFSPLQRALFGLMFLVSFPSLIAMATAGLGSFSLKNWARSCAIWSAVGLILSSTVREIVEMPSTMNIQNPFLNQEGMGSMTTVSNVVASLLKIFFSALIPAFILIVYNLKSVKLAFLTGGAPPSGMGGGWGGQQQYAAPAPYYPPEAYYPPPPQQGGPPPPPGYYPPQGPPQYGPPPGMEGGYPPPPPGYGPPPPPPGG